MNPILKRSYFRFRLKNKKRKVETIIHESSSCNLLVLGEPIRCDWHHFKVESHTSCKVAICSFSPAGNNHLSQEFSCHESPAWKERIPRADGLSLLSESFTLLYGINLFYFVFEFFGRMILKYGKWFIIGNILQENPLGDLYIMLIGHSGFNSSVF